MSRPPVSVVMPFAGDVAAAQAALATLSALRVAPGDQRILADNQELQLDPPPGIEIVPAGGERSPAHARNAGAAHATGDWILFLDSDCLAPGDLLERYFLEPVDPAVGALAGEVVAAGSPATLAERYGAAKSFLSQRAHLAHRYLPRAAAANLLVRRTAFERLGGFYEGLRAAEDTDFSWRLQQAGWRLELREAAHVEHRYRVSLSDLRRQWRGYAAGRAWLARRYPGFTPEPAASRGLRRLRHRAPVAPPVRTGGGSRSRRERASFLAVDALLAGEELAGLVLSNRPADEALGGHAEVVLVAERFPADGDPLVEFALSLSGVRVEAAVRPGRVAAGTSSLRVDYREDDGVAVRALAVTELLLSHPLRCLRDRWRRPSGAPLLSAVAPAAVRLLHDPPDRVHALGNDAARSLAGRLGALSGVRHEHSTPRPQRQPLDPLRRS